MDKKQLFIDCKLNFNLYNPNGKRPTLIYAVVYFKGKQYRISTGLKIYPKQWNRKRQIASINKKQTELDNYNNSIVNEKLRHILFSFEQGKLYLCNHMESLTDFRELLKQHINPNMVSRKKKTEGSVPATTQMQLLLSEVEKDSTRCIYQGNISIFKRFLDESSISDTWSTMTGDTLEKFKEHMSSKGRTVATINNCLTGIKVMLKKADKNKDIDFDFHASGCHKVEKLKDQRTKDEKKSKQIPLTEEQIQKLYSLKLSGKDKEVRDVFVAQCLLGQRISDMSKLFAGNYKIVDEDLVEITVQKTGEQAVIYLFSTAKEILERYRTTGFTYLNIETETDKEKGSEEQKSQNYASRINERIKIICQTAGFNEEISYTEQRGTKKTTVRKKFYELIHTHLARHTFITLMCRMGIDKETVIIATGHEDTKMIDEVYLHTSSLDKARKLGKAIREKAKGSMFIANQTAEDKDVNVFNYVFAGDLLSSLSELLAQGVKISDLEEAKEAIKILKDIGRVSKIDLEKHRNDPKLRTQVAEIAAVVWSIGIDLDDIALIQLFQSKVVKLGLKGIVLHERVMKEPELRNLLEIEKFPAILLANLISNNSPKH